MILFLFSYIIIIYTSSKNVLEDSVNLKPNTRIVTLKSNDNDVNQQQKDSKYLMHFSNFKCINIIIIISIYSSLKRRNVNTNDRNPKRHVSYNSNELDDSDEEDKKKVIKNNDLFRNNSKKLMINLKFKPAMRSSVVSTNATIRTKEELIKIQNKDDGSEKRFDNFYFS